MRWNIDLERQPLLVKASHKFKECFCLTAFSLPALAAAKGKETCAKSQKQRSTFRGEYDPGRESPPTRPTGEAPRQVPDLPPGRGSRAGCRHFAAFLARQQRNDAVQGGLRAFNIRREPEAFGKCPRRPTVEQFRALPPASISINSGPTTGTTSPLR